MSLANPLWGAPRIHGELLKLGIDVGQTITDSGRTSLHIRNVPDADVRAASVAVADVQSQCLHGSARAMIKMAGAARPDPCHLADQERRLGCRFLRAPGT
jgi:hypothetical protein